MHLYFRQISMNMKLFTIKFKSGQLKLAFTYIVIGFFHHETIHRLRQHNCGLFLTHQYVNVNTVKNTSVIYVDILVGQKKSTVMLT